ncbi:MAG: rRNA maturation RNase YbeY [Proteobacteria bacterium]|nr:rRNA maturation RNase YbeY [Pseudomonadota bacterium]NCV46084.1 rRNA maturation RNase YbeY [Pseudomonadota bacterium]NCX42502.1 rRNA maturation RNase YbeY [Pseudomonadota bacterium]NCX74593.1 rRNA maturation RNase YbeY [Pseudomonadota bacterium]NDH59440.1 rRNA maturation RNase YbeY [Pseudomonadota bacterium]
MSLIISLDEGIDIEKPLNNKLNKIVSTILEQEKMSDCVINLRLLNDKEMKKLNMQFRQKDKTTNVLSFPNDDISVKQTKNIGDIAISVEYVKAEAKKEGKTFDDHIIHMLAHGVYHILGYDHENNENAVIMENKEIQTLKKINISNPY